MRENAEARLSGQILSTSATMLGACITVISVVRLLQVNTSTITVIDDIVAVGGGLFLMAALLSYLSIRSSQQRARRLEAAADVCFLVALTIVAAAGLMLAWELG